MSKRTADLMKLQPTRVRAGGKNPLSEAEGVDIIRACRRGVSMVALHESVGVSYGNLYTMLGTWALRYAVISEDAEKPDGGTE